MYIKKKKVDLSQVKLSCALFENDVVGSGPLFAMARPQQVLFLFLFLGKSHFWGIARASWKIDL